MSTDSDIDVGVQGNSNENKFLSFCLGDEEFGVEILRVREIIGLMDITPIPQTPSYVKGVINLRGKIIPVIELRTKFGLESVAYTEETCVIVVEVADGPDSEMFLVGMIVDRVNEVLDVPSSAIEPPPSLGCAVDVSYLTGIAKTRDRVVALLSLDAVVAVSAIAGITAMAGGGSPQEETHDHVSC